MRGDKMARLDRRENSPRYARLAIDGKRVPRRAILRPPARHSSSGTNRFIYSTRLANLPGLPPRAPAFTSIVYRLSANGAQRREHTRSPHD